MSFLCPICLVPLNNPRTLPCRHDFCSQCLQKSISYSDTSVFRCPMCRSFAAPKDRSLPLNICARGFPLVKLNETTGKKEENPIPFYCDNCLKDNVTIDITFYTDCQTKLCIDCQKNHCPEVVDEDFATTTMQQPLSLSDDLVFFCVKCCTLTYAHKHPICEEENAVKTIPAAAEEIRKLVQDEIENLKHIKENFINILNNEILKKQHQDDLEVYDKIKTLIFSSNENICQEHTQHLMNLDRLACKIQQKVKDIHDILERLLMLQKVSEDLEYLKEYIKETIQISYRPNSFKDELNEITQKVQKENLALNN